ncbi:MAG: LamG domain-containing protein [Planctomycetota bacterium]
MCRRLFCFVALILILGVVAPGVGAGDPTLMGWWTFDGHTQDISGNGRHGTIHGSPTFVPGVFGEALHFEANPDYVTIDGYKGVLGTSAYSIACWVKTTNTAQQQIMHWGTDSNGQRVEFRIQANRLRISGGGGNVQGDTDVTDGEWHHVAAAVIENASASSGDVTFYVDGQDDTQETTNAIHWDIVPNATLDVTIGMRPTRPDRYFIGDIDEVLLYEKTLTPEEILQIIEGGGAEPYPFAYGPSPEDGAMRMDTWVNLAWSAGAKAVSHDVYLGSDFDTVNDATRDSDVFRGNQTAEFVIAGFVGNPYPEGLAPGTTYYWRIDEVNDADPNSPWKGDIWSFSIPPRTAYNPDPAVGAELVDPNNIALSWTPGFGAILHTVYFGDDYNEVDNAAGGTPLGPATFNPGPLEREKVYYWRVDESDVAETHKGDIWGFTTPGAAASLEPTNGSADVQVNATLSWTPAGTADSHDLYFGTDRAAVLNATTDSLEYKGNRAKGSESYDPGVLELSSEYFWRVDAIYGTGPVKGLVWAFTTADFLLIDNFESYNDIEEDQPGSNRIYLTWIDGFDNPATNGAIAGNLDVPLMAPGRESAQSMPVSYDNAGKTSEVTRTLTSRKDWTEQGVTRLVVWFSGDAANAADRMFVALGNAIVYHPDDAATQDGGWNEWVIDLQEFADQGVDLTNVGSITIGFGTRNAPVATGGTGTVEIDDIRLIR